MQEKESKVPVLTVRPRKMAITARVMVKLLCRYKQKQLSVRSFWLFFKRSPLSSTNYHRNTKVKGIC